MKATKREWIRRQQIIDQMRYDRLTDRLVSALWDAVEKIKPIQQSVQNARQSLAKKYALRDDNGEVQTKKSLVAEIKGDSTSEGNEGTPAGEVEAAIADYTEVQTQRGTTILVKDPDQFEEAVREILQEEVDLDINAVPLQEALNTGASMSDLITTVGWIIETRKGREANAGEGETQATGSGATGSDEEISSTPPETTPTNGAQTG